MTNGALSRAATARADVIATHTHISENRRPFINPWYTSKTSTLLLLFVPSSQGLLFDPVH